jgi:hypothetical protein
MHISLAELYVGRFCTVSGGSVRPVALSRRMVSDPTGWESRAKDLSGKIDCRMRRSPTRIRRKAAGAAKRAAGGLPADHPRTVATLPAGVDETLSVRRLGIDGRLPRSGRGDAGPAGFLPPNATWTASRILATAVS